MGCGENINNQNSGANCVSRILKDIVAAQNDVVDNDCCDTSCEQSISDLLGETEQGNDLDTVPVILYCKGTCKPFKGYGVGYYTHNGHKHLKQPVGSFVFRVKKVTDDNCAVLELLLCKSHKWHAESTVDACKGDSYLKTPACQSTKYLRSTGLCLTVDLDCFCHVTCLPAIEAL